MGEFLSAQQYRARQIRYGQRYITSFTEREIIKQGAAWYPNDAPLQKDDHSFESWFRPVLPFGSTDMRAYVEDTLAPFEKRVGLELGGVGSNLFAGFSQGYFDTSAGVNLTDTRIHRVYPQFSAQKIDSDNQRNHHVIPGNILDDITKERVLTWLNGAKAAFIVERMYAGIYSLPKEPFYMSQEVGFWYNDVLAQGGLIFAQVPHAFTPYIKQWEAYCKENHSTTVDVQVNKYDEKNVVRMHKLTNDPLPLLNARDVIREERKQYSRHAQ